MGSAAVSAVTGKKLHKMNMTISDMVAVLELVRSLIPFTSI